jgi:hypothetical protein
MDGAPYHVVCGLALNLLHRWVPACGTHSPGGGGLWRSLESSAPSVVGVGSEQQPRITGAVGRMNLHCYTAEDARPAAWYWNAHPSLWCNGLVPRYNHNRAWVSYYHTKVR